jgi:hypothetical protein
VCLKLDTLNQALNLTINYVLHTIITDVGVLFQGSTSGGGGGSSNTGLIVGVAVAVPLAVVAVVLIILGGLLFRWYRRRHLAHNRAGGVSLDDDLDDNDDLDPRSNNEL